MGKKAVLVLALLVLAICLVSGGCLPGGKPGSLKDWGDLLRASTKKESNPSKAPHIDGLGTDQQPEGSGEKLVVELYFVDANGRNLVREQRSIAKTQAIARKTLETLIIGPEGVDTKPVFPADTRLLDINLKPDGLCIVDFSSEVNRLDAEEAQLLVYAVANTLGQFPTVKEVAFLVDGQKVSTLGGQVDISVAITPDYDFKL